MFDKELVARCCSRSHLVQGACRSLVACLVLARAGLVLASILLPAGLASILLAAALASILPLSLSLLTFTFTGLIYFHLQLHCVLCDKPPHGQHFTSYRKAFFEGDAAFLVPPLRCSPVACQVDTMLSATLVQRAWCCRA